MIRVFYHGPLHGERIDGPEDGREYRTHVRVDGETEIFVYVPHPTYPNSAMILDSERSSVHEAFLEKSPKHRVVKGAGSLDFTLFGEYHGKLYTVDDIQDELDEHFRQYGCGPESIEIVVTLRREEG